MFWNTKVECDGCSAKIAKQRAIYHRGSYFCNATCRDTWEVANPPRMATGDPATLARDLVQTIDVALEEYRLANAPSDNTAELVSEVMDAVVDFALPLRGAEHDEIVRSERLQRFNEYTHECIPIVRALGYREEVVVLERFGFGAHVREVIAALQRARARAVQQLH